MPTPSPNLPANAGSTPSIPRRPRRLALQVGKTAGLVILGIALLAASALACVWQSLRTESGTRWWLRHVPGLLAEGTRGALLGDFSAQRLTLNWGLSIEIDQLSWQGVHWTPWPARGLWAGLRIDLLRSDAVRIHPKPSPEPAKAPSELKMPLSIEVQSLLIRTLEIAPETSASAGPQSAPAATTPWRDLQASLLIGANAGNAHQLTVRHLDWGALQAEGQAHIEATAPLNLNAHFTVSAQPSSTPPGSSPQLPIPWTAQLECAGPLAEPHLKVALSATTTENPQPAETLTPRLSLEATLRPWDAWPLGMLKAEGSGIDLSSFHATAPRTALRARATASTRSADQPAILMLQLDNDGAGLWNESRVPLRSVSLEAQALPEHLSEVLIRQFKAEWGTRASLGGRTEGSGRVSLNQWSFDTRWTDLQPSLLDARAAAMRLSGPLRVSHHDMLWEAEAQWAGVLLEPLAATALRTPPVELQLSLHTKQSASPHEPEIWMLRHLKARIDAAELRAEGTLSRSQSAAPWHAKGRVNLIHFDPLPWWPGTPGSVWHEGGHRFNGTAIIDLQNSPRSKAAALDRATPLAPWLDWLQGWRGSGRASLTDSRLAGIPLSGSAELQHTGAAPHFQLEVQTGGNLLKLNGALPWPAPTGKAPADAASHLSFDLNASDLARLNPWFTLASPRRTAKSVLSGKVQASGTISSQWPQLNSEGQAEFSNLRWEALQLQSGLLRWHVGNTAASPLDIDLRLAQTTWQGRGLNNLTLQSSGQVDNHKVYLDALIPGQPPLWIQTLQGSSHSPTPALAATAASTTVSMDVQGGWVLEAKAGESTPSAPTGWHGVIQSLRAGRESGAWFRTLGAVKLTADWPPQKTAPKPDGSQPVPPFRLKLAPGRAELAGTTLQWDAVDWAHSPSAPTDLQAHARIESLRVAPILASLQPDFGWGGDLALGLEIHLRTLPEFSIEALIERREGDLQVIEEGNTQPLGLNTLRLMLGFKGGQWTFTQAIAGDTLGVVAGALVATPHPGSIWPDAQTPLQGVLELRVAQLGAWGTWLPAGWRLAGQLHLGAGLGGRWGAPEINGAIDGRNLSLRHLLEGVDITDGTLDIQLSGTSAKIERFSARSGAGNLQIQGTADLGEAPQAALKLSLDHFQLLGRVDRKLIVSGQAELKLTRDTTSLAGQSVIDEGLIDFSRGNAPRLSDDVHIVRAQPATVERSPARPAPTTTTRRPPTIKMKVNLGEKLRLKGRGLETRLQGELDITSPEGQLQVRGKVNAVDGTYRAYAQKLSIDKGTISFTGDASNPRLDIEATRPNTDTRVGVAITGSAQSPRIRLFSEPDMPDTDKLSWLTLGRSSEGLASTDIGLLQTAAVALLSGEHEGPSDQLTRAIGLDELSVRKNEDGGVSQTIVSMGKQLSRRWYVGYERGLNATEGSWQLIYRIAQRFTLRAQTGHENSVDLIWTWRWQ